MPPAVWTQWFRHDNGGASFVTFGRALRPVVNESAWLVWQYRYGAWTLGKPPVVSLLDVPGPWPWYLVPVVRLGILNVLLLYAPFWWADRRRARRCNLRASASVG